MALVAVQSAIVITLILLAMIAVKWLLFPEIVIKPLRNGALRFANAPYWLIENSRIELKVWL